MKKKVVIGLSLVGAVSLQANGYKIPEQSLRGTALAAANVANASSADASYYNPANMAWLPDTYMFDAALTYINLPKVKYEDNRSSTMSGESKSENFALPTFHAVTKEYYGGWRFGFSTVVPSGLSKRWQSAYPKTTAENFSLKVIEVNPTFSYKINDQLAIGGGLRILYSTGKVQSDGMHPGIGHIKRDMEGDSVDFGYNLAVSFRATPEWTLAATYRSKVNLTETGTAKLTIGTPVYDGYAKVSIPLPAQLALATSYRFNNTTVEFVYERNFWSAYKDLDFGYDREFPVFDESMKKEWKDTSTYRLGLSHQLNESLLLMGGYTYNENPVPDETLGFELPDSDSHVFSTGLEYKVDKNLTLGVAYLYSHKKKRSVKNGEGIDGRFTGSGAHLASIGLSYRF